MKFDNEILKDFVEAILSQNFNIYLVGGSVRDYLLGVKSYDYDFAVIATPEKHYRLTEYISNLFNVEYRYNDYYNTSKFEIGGIDIDLVMARKEYYPVPACKPIIKSSIIEDDLKRRDFTINSIAFDFKNYRYIDILNGINDLKKGIIKILHKKSFIDDPIRIFRAIKYASRLNFNYDEMTESLMVNALMDGFVNLIPKQRISNEISAILKEKNFNHALNELLRLNILGTIFNKHIMLNCSLRQQYFLKLNDEEKLACVFFNNKHFDLEEIVKEFCLSRDFLELTKVIKTLCDIVRLNKLQEIYSFILKNEKRLNDNLLMSIFESEVISKYIAAKSSIKIDENLIKNIEESKRRDFILEYKLNKLLEFGGRTDVQL
ncbi:CCA tRNA nucleotidyltransferase [Caloramator mitchellensis]|nr:CCA tRNA nucleotidyltransferase [Caloramator mitchellensis]